MWRTSARPQVARQPVLDLPELAYVVLDLDLNKLPPALVEGQFDVIQKQELDPAVYYAKYQPLIVEEAVAVIKAALNKGDSKKDYAVELDIRDRLRYYPDEDVSVIDLKGDERVDCAKEMSSSRFIVAAIPVDGYLLVSIIDIFPAGTRIVLKGNYQDFLADGGHFKITPLSSLLNLDRMYSLCESQPDSPLLQRIREARVSPWLETVEDSASATASEVDELNAHQRQAVKSFVAAEEGVYLLQGPPGTGKTTTIVQMLKGLAASDQRTLVCAPSNKAVQVLASRTVSCLPDEPVVLIGVGSKVPPELQSVFLDNWVQRFPEKLESLLTEIDVISQLAPSDEENALHSRARQTINFQRLSVVLQQLTQQSDRIKQLLSGCLRYAVSIKPIDRRRIEQGVAAGLSHYFDLLASLQTIGFSTAFPSLGSHVVPVTVVNLLAETEALQRKMRECYRDFSGKVLYLLQHCIPRENNQLLEYASIVFCTLSIAGRPSLQRQCSQQQPFSAVIVDEAGQSVEAETLIAFGLASSATKAVLVGDPRQLPATTIARSSQESNFEWSMLWRLLEENKQPVLDLRVQYRMRQHINHFPSSRYYEGRLLGHDSIAKRHCHSAHCIPREGLSVWLDIKGREEGVETSYINRSEALAVVELVKALRLRDGVSHIGIISFYGQQVALLRKLLSQAGLKLDNITVSTVDGFQGDEKDIMIVSFVRANDQSRIGFLGDFRRLNVAITRAKDALFICGDERTYRRLPKDSELNELLEFHRKMGSVISLDKVLENISRDRRNIPSRKLQPLPVVKPIGSVINPVMRYIKGSAARTAPRSVAKSLTVADLYNADELIALAQRLFDQMKYEEAIDKYNTALEREPGRADVYERLVACYEAMEEPANAQMMREIASSLKVEANGHAQSSAAATARVKIPVAAVACAPDRFVVVGAPAKKKIHAGLGTARSLSDAGRYQEAEDAYRQLLDLDPTHSEVLLGYGWTLHKQRKNTEAAQQFERSLKVHKSPLAYQGLIQCKRYLEEREEALDLVYEALDDFPWSKVMHRLKHELENKPARHARSSAGFFSGRVAAAAPAAAAASVVPVVAPRPAVWQVAAAHVKTSTVRKGVSAPLSVARIHAKKVTPKELDAAHDLSRRQQRPDLAEAAYAKLLERAPQNPAVLTGMGWALLSQRKNQAALPFFIESLKYKKDPSAYYGLARGYFFCHQKREASAVIEDCLSQHPHEYKAPFQQMREFQREITRQREARPRA